MEKKSVFLSLLTCGRCSLLLPKTKPPFEVMLMSNYQRKLIISYFTLNNQKIKYKLIMTKNIIIFHDLLLLEERRAKMIITLTAKLTILLMVSYRENYLPFRFFSLLVVRGILFSTFFLARFSLRSFAMYNPRNQDAQNLFEV